MKENDDQWLWFLYTVCEQLQLERTHFYAGTIFDELVRIYKRDE